MRDSPRSKQRKMQITHSKLFFVFFGCGCIVFVVVVSDVFLVNIVCVCSVSASDFSVFFLFSVHLSFNGMRHENWQHLSDIENLCFSARINRLCICLSVDAYGLYIDFEWKIVKSAMRTCGAVSFESFDSLPTLIIINQTEDHHGQLMWMRIRCSTMVCIFSLTLAAYCGSLDGDYDGGRSK